MQSSVVKVTMQQEMSPEEMELERQLEALRFEIQIRKKRSRQLWEGHENKKEEQVAAEDDKKVVGKFTLHVTKYEW